MELEDRRADKADLEAVLQRAGSQLEISPELPEAAEFADLARGLLKTERRYTDYLISDVRTLFDDLLDLDTAERQLITETDARFMGERVLWVRSARSISLSDTPAAVSAVRWLANPNQWQQLGAAMGADASRNAVL